MAEETTKVTTTDNQETDTQKPSQQNDKTPTVDELMAHLRLNEPKRKRINLLWIKP